MHDILDANAKLLREAAETPAAIGFNDDDRQERASDPRGFPYVAEYPKDMQFGIAVVGNSINKLAQDGDTLVCVRTGAAGAEPQDGDLVVIEVLDNGNTRVAIRRLRRIGDVCEFRHESKDPAFQDAPLTCDLRQDDGKVRMLGKVLLACRRLGA